MLVELIIILVSLVVLAKSSEIVVNSASKLSAFFGISQTAMGFILLSTSTSLPELSVSVVSSAVENGAIAAGNVFGSNIADILLVLGIGAYLYGIKITKKEVQDIALILLGTSVITLFVIYFAGLNRIAGLLLIAIFAAYVLYLGTRKIPGDHPERVTKLEALNAFLWFCGGILAVLISSGFVVESAVRLADGFGIAKSFIGATLIAVGTSLPELSLAVQAIRMKRYGLALGDAIGSSMTNITLVLGVAAVLNPIVVTLRVFMPVVLFALLANLIFFYLITTRQWLRRKEGAYLLLAYFLFLIVISGAQLYVLNPNW